jgi:predicted dehydrogenase
MSTIQIGLIGYGYWGPNLLRNFALTEGITVHTVVDLKPENLSSIRKRYPTVQISTDVGDILNNPKIHAVAIATPVMTHFDLAMRALNAGKHVFIEKPLASNSKDAKKLVDLAEKKKLTLFVDHTFIYTSAVRKIKDLIANGTLGKIHYYDAVRINLGLFRHDINVLWDLAVHDLSIMDYLLGQKPIAVSATGMSHVANQPENIAYLTCLFDNNFIAHMHVNWLAPVKIRKTLISGEKKMIVYDDLEVTERVKVYDEGIVVNPNADGARQMLVNYRLGDVWAPHLNNVEALLTESKHFVDCIQHHTQPLSDGRSALRIVHILEAASKSMAQNGRRINIDWKGIA